MVAETKQWSDIEADGEHEAGSRNGVMVAYRAIKKKILTGEVKSGELLPQSRLAAEFNTSRGPIREALRLLQREGLIDAETNQRARVASFDPGDLEQVSAAMILNIGAAIYVGAQRMKKADVAALIKDIDQIEAAARARRKIGAPQTADDETRQVAFRQLIIALCGLAGSQPVQIVNSLFDRIAIFRQMGSARRGETATFPLPEKLNDLRAGIQNGDASALALGVITLIEHLAHFGLDQMTEGYTHHVLDRYVELARRSIPASDGSLNGAQVVLPQGATITVQSMPNGRVGYTITSQ